MSNKMWDALVEHAKTCVLGGKLYIYYPEGPQGVGVIFNSIYEFSGLIAGGQYYSTDSLSDTQKVSSPKPTISDLLCFSTFLMFFVMCLMIICL